MMADRASVTDVTDTAFWVAALRAKESKRTNAVSPDPLASLLAGTRGIEIARSIPQSALVGWGIVMRTSAIDGLIDDAVRKGIGTVINLGAGLDTRPYRMKLPRQMRWIEIDFPGIVRWKNTALAGYTPACNVQRIGMDLLDRRARDDLFKASGSRGAATLLIAEGVLPYLANDDVTSLASDLHSIPSFRYWILDFDNAGIRKAPAGWARRLEAAPFLFQPNDWFKFFESCGWHAHTVITSAEESERLNRPYPWAFPWGPLMHALPRDMRRRILSVSGVALMSRITGHLTSQTCRQAADSEGRIR
jgi:methyltransferase (TIGR00027 family)